MAYFRSESKVSVEKLDNGWLLDWSEPSPEEPPSSLQQWRHRVAKRTSGRELFTDKKKLLKRIETLLGA